MKLKIAFLLLAAPMLGFGQSNEWQNPKVNAVNRFPMHTNYFAYENESLAAAANKEASANFLSLNGLWKFNWVSDLKLKKTITPVVCTGTIRERQMKNYIDGSQAYVQTGW